MRVCFVPFFKINLGVVVALFFLRIALPRLIRLFMGALIRLLARVVFGGLFAHGDTSTDEYIKLRTGLRFLEGIEAGAYASGKRH